MKKICILAVLAISAALTAQVPEADFMKTLVDEQDAATKGMTQLYALDYYLDGSLLLLSSYQTATAEEVGMTFCGNTYSGATAAKWGAQEGDFKYTNMRNSFMAKLDSKGDLLWAVADTVADFDLANIALTATADGGAVYVQKFRTRQGVYTGLLNLYGSNGNVVASTEISFTHRDSIVADGKKVFRKEAFSWAGVAVDEDRYIYVAGQQADTLLPSLTDSVAPRKAWNTKGSMSSNCNTVILKYKVQDNQTLEYVGAVINSDELVYDRPVGLHYENGKLYVAGTYSSGTETGLYAARYDKNLTREYIQYQPVTGTLQFQQTKFEDGKMFICGGLAKGSITLNDKTLATTGNFNHGLIYALSMEDGSPVNVALYAAAKNALNITVAAYPTKDGYVAYNHETLNGISTALYYDQDMNFVSADTLSTGGGSSSITAVGRSLDGNRTAVGLRARTSADFNVLGETMNFADKTNWYSVIAAINTQGQKIATGLDKETQRGQVVSRKVVRNGQLYIVRDGKTYNALGAEVTL